MIALHNQSTSYRILLVILMHTLSLSHPLSLSQSLTLSDSEGMRSSPLLEWIVFMHFTNFGKQCNYILHTISQAESEAPMALIKVAGLLMDNVIRPCVMSPCLTVI